MYICCRTFRSGGADCIRASWRAGRRLLAVVIPETAMVISYFVLVWYTLAAYIDAHPQDVFNRVVSGSSDIWLIVV